MQPSPSLLCRVFICAHLYLCTASELKTPRQLPYPILDAEYLPFENHQTSLLKIINASLCVECPFLPAHQGLKAVRLDQEKKEHLLL